MKILWDNYLDDSTITATSENSLYPVSNLTDKFLERKFQAVGTSSVVTVTFPEDRTVSMIAYGYNNVTTSDTIRLSKTATDTIRLSKTAVDTVRLSIPSDYTLKNSGGSVISTGQLSIGNDVNITYLTPTVCRSIVFSFSAQSTMYVGGVAVGDPIEYDYIQVNPQLIASLRGDFQKTTGGQLVGRKTRLLREWRVTFPNLTNQERMDTMEMLRAVGNFKPVFADIELYGDAEEAIYGNFENGDVSFRRDSTAKTYSTGLTLQEAR